MRNYPISELNIGDFLSHTDLREVTKLAEIAAWNRSLIITIPFLVIYAAITGDNISVNRGMGAAYSAGLMITAGLIMLIYVSIKSLRTGYNEAK